MALDSRKTGLVAACLVAFGGSFQTAWAGDCWLDIYDKADFQGAHARIEGPKELPSLQGLEGEDWRGRIESLAVGPKAQVLVFKQENFKSAPSGPVYHGDAIERWGENVESYSTEQAAFGPGKRIHHLGELSLHRVIHSLKVNCLP